MKKHQFLLSNVSAMQSEEGFVSEQARLGKTWTCVGTTKALAAENAWFRTTLAGRSIFVQRTRKGIRAFENRCAHRSFPLRTTDEGQGPIVCGFHHWRYDDEGCALGIPKCQDMFNVAPRELDARLTPVDVEVCGELIFARFPTGESQPDLQTHLGTTYEVIRSISGAGAHQHRFFNDVSANWRLIAHISLDDYHLVAVHPKSFGKNGYLDPSKVSYHEDGWHSAYFSGRAGETMQTLSDACRTGAFAPKAYKTWFVFPNLVVSHVHVLSIAGISVCYFLVLFYEPRSYDRTRLHVIYQPSPFSTRGEGLWNVGHEFFERIRSFFVGRSARQVISEDNAICEALQTNMVKSDGTVYLAKHEMRIQSFERSYTNALK